MVDYVVIDQNAKPIENLQIIQPDYFAKGYEYVKNDINPRTKEEKDVLESFGGEIIFTPGDIIYSSSHLIELSPPTISVDRSEEPTSQLQSLMRISNAVSSL